MVSNSQASKIKEDMENHFFRASAEDFMSIPGSVVSYWASPKVINLFKSPSFENHASVRQGMATTDNDRFLRKWYEISFRSIGFNFDSPGEGNQAGYSWFPYNKGGEFRKWYGNLEYIVNYEKNGDTLIQLVRKKYPKISDPEFVIKNRSYYCKEAITWSDVTSGATSFRYIPKGMLFDGRGSCIFPLELSINKVIGFLNSPITMLVTSLLNPTLVLNPGEIKKIPFPDLPKEARLSELTNLMISTTRSDWDSYEVSWDFASLPMLHPGYRQAILQATYQRLRAHWREATQGIQRLEEENNRIFIDAYGLQDELTPDVPLNEITLTCNPHYRYKGNKTEEELEAELLADTMREFISYAVGCMLGRYSLDKPGLILANQGETLADYLKQVPQPRFTPDKDNVIPMLDGDWFADDIVERFRQFLRVTFGEERYEENLQFIEQALNTKGKRNYTLRDYFLSEFYTDHIKRYKKRPIYWLFSSPKGSFNALIYMHRYRPDTVSVVLNDYLREFRAKLDAHLQHLQATSISADSSQGDKTKALKEIDKVTKTMAELEDYERDVLYPLATQQIEIDLDDGVKVNYPKLGAALKRIPGLEAKDED